MKIAAFKIKQLTVRYSKNFKPTAFVIRLKNKKLSSLFTEQLANNLASWLLDTSTTKKSFDRWVTLTIPAKAANLLPPIGPFLGQHGFNTLSFCNTFNNLTKNYPEGVPIKTIIKLFSDKTLNFQFKTPPVSFLLYSASQLLSTQKLTVRDILKIALIKKIDLVDCSLISLFTTIMGTARSMKLKIY